MAAILNGGKLILTGYVGDSFFDDGFTHGEVVMLLAQIEDSDELTVYLNSGGGYASDGAAIHALLARRSGTTDVVVDGVAASAASLIAMAGDTVTMSAGSVMMIHDPQNITFGDSAAHAKTIEELEAFATAYSRVYAAKSGKTPAECREIMKTERWFSPEQAVEEGFADAVGETQASAVAAFDYRAYAHAPQRLVALAAKKNWRLPDASTPAASAAQSSRKQEKSMTDKERADQLAAELEALKAQMKSGKDAEAVAALQAELDQLRAEKTARANADAIMALEEAKGREDQAKALADAGVAVEQAKAILAAGPKAEAEPDNRGQRLNGEGLAPTAARPSAKGDRSILADAVARTNKRR